jgi:hypothetical protein
VIQINYNPFYVVDDTTGIGGCVYFRTGFEKENDIVSKQSFGSLDTEKIEFFENHISNREKLSQFWEQWAQKFLTMM